MITMITIYTVIKTIYNFCAQQIGNSIMFLLTATIAVKGIKTLYGLLFKRKRKK